MRKRLGIEDLIPDHSVFFLAAMAAGFCDAAMTYQSVCAAGQPVGLPLREPAIDDGILAARPSELAQSSAKRLQEAPANGTPAFLLGARTHRQCNGRLL